jgi:transposase
LPWASQEPHAFYDITLLQSYVKYYSDAQNILDEKCKNWPSLRLSLYYGLKSKLPTSYDIYQGGANDEVDLKYIKNAVEILARDNILFVFDRMFLNEAGIRFLMNYGLDFIMPLHESLKSRSS